jgi:anaerobic magnesium-protoporphyrin IX monomethyl ester cyclase
MKVVLINSPLFRNSIGKVREDSLPPLGLGYIATYLERNDIEFEFIDAVREDISMKQLIKKLYCLRPEFVALNIFSTNFLLVKEIISELKFETQFIIGGPATKSLSDKIINWTSNNQINIVIGDGELIIVDLIKNNLKERAIYEGSNRRVFNVDEDSVYFLHDISSAFLIDRKTIGAGILQNIYGLSEMSLITGRGCIYNCAFCGAARKLNPKCPLRERSEISIVNELVEIKSNYPDCKSIRILDDLFLKNPASIDKAIEIFSQFDFQWRAMAHIKTFTNVKQSKIEELRKSGCNELFVGIESGSPRILQFINKTSNRSHILSTLGDIFSAGINVKGYFIYGFPNETKEDMRLTYNLANEIKDLSLKWGVNFRISVFQFRPYHGTELFLNLKAQFPDIENHQISHNKALSNLIGRGQFNFYSFNYSSASLRTIHSYICKTNDLNGSRTFIGPVSRQNRYKYQKTV